ALLGHHSGGEEILGAIIAIAFVADMQFRGIRTWTNFLRRAHGTPQGSARETVMSMSAATLIGAVAASAAFALLLQSDDKSMAWMAATMMIAVAAGAAWGAIALPGMLSL